jgi:hypothetical protein
VLSDTEGTAAAINDRGEVAGYYYVGRGDSFTWRRGRLTEIRPPADFPEFALLQARAINDRGRSCSATATGGTAGA